MRAEHTAGGVDLSVILTAHDETLVCGPTVTSANKAIEAAEAAGITVEKIVVLDNATSDTKAWFSQPALDSWTRMEFHEGDLGRVRNAVLPKTCGRFIAFLDSDDLFSENWLREGVKALRAAEDEGKRAIAHPELNWLFDGANSVYLKPAQDETLFTPWHFFAMNYYDSLCMCPRAAHQDHPYVHRDIPNGLSYQDWQFSIETMAGDWTHLCVRDTIIFKRRRNESLVSESRNRRSLVRQLDAMAIDKVAALGGVSPQANPEPDSLEICRPVQPERRLRGLARRLLRKQAPPVPDTRDTPHYGAYFAERIAKAKAINGHLKRKHKRQYALVAANFDVPYYLANNQDIRQLEHFDPVAHYLRAGWKEGRNPAPWFSTRNYLERYPAVRKNNENPFFHWLTEGFRSEYSPVPVRDFDTVAETMGLTPSEALAAWKVRYTDLQERLAYGALGAQVKAAACHDPLIEETWMEAIQVKLPPMHSEAVCARTATMWRLAQAAGLTRAKHVICVNRARFGGAARVEGHLARSLKARDGAGSVLLVTTDHAGDLPEGKLPSGVRHVDFAAIATNLKAVERERMLAEFLRMLHPETVFNINSRLLWDAITPYGKALATSMRLYACLLCNEQAPLGHWTGYPLRRFYRHFDELSGIVTDSHFLAKELQERYLLPVEWTHKLRVLSNPVDPQIPVASITETIRPQIFWGGRLDRQKRPDLLAAIAEALPEADFHVWGQRVMDADSLPDRLPGNLNLHEPYERFSDLPLDKADLWLYTSAWDGVPSMLLEVAMSGLPIVGSDVGGTTEVLRPELARALPPDASVKDWIAAIRAVLSDHETARKQALSLRKTLLSERNIETHAAALNDLLESTDRGGHDSAVAVHSIESPK